MVLAQWYYLRLQTRQLARATRAAAWLQVELGPATGSVLGKQRSCDHLSMLRSPIFASKKLLVSVMAGANLK